MKQQSYSQQSYSQQSSAVAILDEIYIVPRAHGTIGIGKMEITSADIAHLVQNFKDGVCRDLPITQGYDYGMSGASCRRLDGSQGTHRPRWNGLRAYVEWSEEGQR